MPNLVINGEHRMVPDGTTVAAAILGAGFARFRRSVSGEARAPLCGMGVCLECRVTIDGEPHRKSCQILVRDGMVVETE
jgi:D-hydroxyproline dehydrogenase subunit gamma